MRAEAQFAGVRVEPTFSSGKFNYIYSYNENNFFLIYDNKLF